MAASCDCNVTLSNTGTPGCMPIQDVAKRLILVPMVDASNVKNRIEIASIPTNTEIIALLNQADDKKRFYPLPEMENVTNERGDPISEDFPSGKNVKIRDGVKTFAGQMLSLSGDYAKQINGFGCSNIGAYIVDAQGNLIGDGSDADYLAPLSLDQETWDVRTMDTTDTTIAKIQLGFQWSISVKDSDVRMLLASDFATDVDWLSYNGLLDLSGTVPTSPAVTATTFDMKITNGFGSLKNPGTAKGLVLASFALNQLTSSTGVISITSVTESTVTPGLYSFVIPSTAGATLELSIAAATVGFDDTKLKTAIITTP
jgi:hypothetical protein